MIFNTELKEDENLVVVQTKLNGGIRVGERCFVYLTKTKQGGAQLTIKKPKGLEVCRVKPKEAR